MSVNIRVYSVKDMIVWKKLYHENVILKIYLKIIILQGLTREALLEDEKGNKMEAMKVFSSVIGYLKDHMWTTCENQLSGIQDSDITWVLTVPAIWNDSSKQFMREAAEKVYIFFSVLVFDNTVF